MNAKRGLFWRVNVSKEYCATRENCADKFVPEISNKYRLKTYETIFSATSHALLEQAQTKGEKVSERERKH